MEALDATVGTIFALQRCRPDDRGSASTSANGRDEVGRRFRQRRHPGHEATPEGLGDEILLLSLLADLAGADGFTDIARFGEKKLALLRRFRH
jgi:hypothetical protein